MEYRTVFDAANVGFNWTPIAFGVGFVAVGSMLVAIRNIPPPPSWRTSPRFNRWFSYFFLAFASLWTILVTYLTYSRYSEIQSAVAAGKFNVVSGAVTDFKPMPYTGHAMERFCVERVCFEYSDYVETPGFHNAASHGGPIRVGLPVRVSYVGNTIVRLEVGARNDG